MIAFKRPSDKYRRHCYLSPQVEVGGKLTLGLGLLLKPVEAKLVAHLEDKVRSDGTQLLILFHPWMYNAKYVQRPETTFGAELGDLKMLIRLS